MFIAPSGTWRRLTVGAVALAFTAAACSSSGSSDTAATQTEATRTDATPGATDAVVESADTAPAAGTAPADAGVGVPEALQFTAPLVGGGEFSGAAVAGKPTLFWFWAPT
jgi:hypothetical protein